MKLYGAIDLHSNNSFTVLLDEKDRVVYEKRLPNDIETIRQQLAPYHDRIQGIAVESAGAFTAIGNFAGRLYLSQRDARAARSVAETFAIGPAADNLLSVQNLFSRNTGQSLSGRTIKQLEPAELEEIIHEPNRTLAITSNLSVMRCLDEQIAHLEKTIKQQAKLRPEFKPRAGQLPCDEESNGI